MDIDLYCEHFCNEPRARAIEFVAELRHVRRSEDYVRAVASLARLILSTDIDRALWINNLGLMYCAFACQAISSSTESCLASIHATGN
jgi:hypothetical protein